MKNTTLYFSTCLVGWLVLFFAVGAASSQTLTLTDVQPASGAPGDRVQLRGRGFDRPAAAYFASVFGGDRGFVLDVTGKSSRTQLSAVVGDVHADVEGAVVLWQGRRSPVAPFRIAGGRFTVRDAYVFRPAAAARGPSFAATAGSIPGVAGRLVDGSIRLDLTPPGSVATASLRLAAAEEDEEPTKEPPPILGLTVEGAGESCGEPTGGSGGGFTAASFGIDFRIECGDQQLCRGNPAILVAEAVEGLAITGLVATVEGFTVVLSGSQPLCGAAFNVTVSPAPAQGGSSLPQGGALLTASADRSSAAISS
ncbi:MAG: hypothetical protein V3T72_05990 [Thermoanaerobaculia bacterium]